MRWIMRNKFTVSLILLSGACCVFGPQRTGAWLASHAKSLIVAIVHFISGFFAAL
jgi:hypothetical protein